MELADANQIASLLSEPLRHSAGHRRPAKHAEREPVYISKQARRGCGCGRCRFCLENARWERIYRQKFADPDYYTRVPVRCESPLNRF
jgi:hypothetical protein